MDIKTFLRNGGEQAVTTDLFWDCECKDNYIRYKSIPACPICKVVRESQPDALLSEVLAVLENALDDDASLKGFTKPTKTVTDEPNIFVRLSDLRDNHAAWQSFCADTGYDVDCLAGAELGNFSIQLTINKAKQYGLI